MAAASRATRIDRAGTRIFETGIFSTISNANLYGSGALMSVTCSVLSERGKYRRGSARRLDQGIIPWLDAASATTMASLTARCAGSGSSNRTLADSNTLLWSWPGSGNTWARVMTELTSGLPSGSVYHDPSLAKTLTAEMADVTSTAACRRLFGIKTHTWSAQQQAGTCGGRIDGAIILVRHPLGALWSEYQRAPAGLHALAAARAANHTISSGHRSLSSLSPSSLGGVPSSRSASRPGWSNAKELEEQHTKGVAKLAGDWPFFAVNNAHAYAQLFNASSSLSGHRGSYWQWAHVWARGALLVRYEDLTNVTTRRAVMRRLLAYAGAQVSDARIACAFESSDLRTVHRPAGGMSVSDALATEPRVAEHAWSIMQPPAAMLGYSWDRRQGPVVSPLQPPPATAQNLEAARLRIPQQGQAAALMDRLGHGAGGRESAVGHFVSAWSI